MFTGIIENLGVIEKISNNKKNLIFKIKNSKIKKKLGASISVNGCCLTVINFDKNSFEVEAIPETLNLTNLGNLKNGDIVNLENSTRVGETIDGHFVSGHIDFKTKVSKIKKDGNSTKFYFEIPKDKLRFFPYKGSVAVNGISLTISKKLKSEIEVSIIPYTLKNTNLGKLKTDSLVNIEIDILARYLDSLLNK